MSRRLGEKIWSAGLHDNVSDGRRGSAWRGENGGLRRGAAIDAQVSRLAKMSAAARKRATMMRLTRLTFAALDHYELTPLTAQRVVLDGDRRLGTAIDVVCVKGSSELVLVELKCGYAGSRTAPALLGGRAQKMKGPLAAAKDSVLHRHLAQLAATHHLFCAEIGTMQALKRKGIENVSGVLLYVNENGTELHNLNSWWSARARRLLDFIA